MCDPDLLEKKTIQLNLKDSELTVCGEVVRERSCVGMGSRFLKGKFMRFGAPFLVLVVGGSFGLKEFSQIRSNQAKNPPAEVYTNTLITQARLISKLITGDMVECKLYFEHCFSGTGELIHGELTGTMWVFAITVHCQWNI
ncbi:uncharacterized protein LOC121869572 isoform X3 [Homarus americanus]|uniref:uncharacterized protein LOC121869572 isoform X3 n=1 Tax=Homarus americanus TaxID=6706 RepID=UPI001C49121A|nr:uncharacterized protein LOC121869572 isoform X3 [Homarus americanus]